MHPDGFAKASPANAAKMPVVRNIFDFSAESLGQLRTWLEQNPPAIPISQLVGYQQQVTQVAPTVVTSENLTNTTYGDLATVGPQLTGLGNGSYIILFGCTSTWFTTGSDQYMSIQVDATVAADADSCSMGTFTPAPTGISMMRLTTKTLSGGGDHTITAKYRSTGAGTAVFMNRWLIALRYATA